MAESTLERQSNSTSHSREGGNPVTFPAAESLITDHIDIWTLAIKQKSRAGRGSSKKFSLHGIKKLRELILELAVRGKLVPQACREVRNSENYEPASVLLERIAAEKAQLLKDKKIKKPKVLPEIGDDEKPFELPNGWEWSQLGFLTNYGVCDKAEPNAVSGEIWVLELEDVEKSTSKLLKKVRFSERVFKSSKNKFEANDVIYGKLRPYLDKVLIADEEGVCTTEMIPVRAYRDLRPDFLRLVMKSPYFIQYANESTHGMNLPRMGTDKARAALFPLAPLEEQHRIVAKVDELMSLCDALETQTEASITAHQTLVETLLNALLLPTNSTNIANSIKPRADSLELSFEQSWQRVAEHFDTLFTTNASIDTLKQTILQLAVMGKLVPQASREARNSESYEPAAKLLERIAAEKAQLIADKKIKKQKPLPAITDEEKPFELPRGWEWVRFEDLVEIQGGITKGRKLAGRELMTVQYLSVANVQRSYLDLGHLKEIEIPIEEEDKYRVKARDLLITEGGDWDKVGRTAIWSNELPYVAHQNHVFKASIFLEEQSEVWLEKYLNGPYARDYFAGSSKQTTNLASINKTQLRGCLLAVPPKEEKDRIVVKVDELMALCDQLKDRLSDAQATQLHLTDAIVEQAV